MSKLCIYCKHLSIDPGWSGTDVTPGDPYSFECGKYVWNGKPNSRQEHRSNMEIGLTCKLFEEAKD